MSEYSRLAVDPELLSRTDAFVRALARGLVADANDAQDVAQQAWLSALERPPSDEGPVRGWLTTIVRRAASRLRRSMARRRAREQQAASPESVPPAQEYRERELLRRAVVDALFALDEPYRTTLLLRFLDDLPPRRVADRMDVPVETVRTRVRRGLALLRERLDAREVERGDRRQAWIALIAPLAKGGVVVSATTKLVGASLAIVVASVLVWRSVEQRHRAAPASRSDSRTAPAETSAAIAPEATRAPEIAPPPASTAEAPSSAFAAAVSPLLDQRGGVDVRVVDENGAPLDGVVVTLQDAGSRAAMVDVPTGITSGDGWCAFSEVAVGSTLVMTEGGHGARTRVEAGERAQVVIRLSGRDALDTILVRGTVVDRDGAPFEDAQILVASVPRLPQSPPCEPREVARTDSAGRFTVPRVETGAFVAACAPGMVPTRWIEASAIGNQRGDHREMELRLVLRDWGGGVRGRVVDGAGRAVPDAAVLVGSDARSMLERETDDATGSSTLPRISLLARTDRDGRFELEGIHPGTESVTARAAGFAPWSGAVTVREDEMAECEITLSPGARVEGFVRDESGQPVADAEIAIGAPLRFTSTRARAHSDGSFRLDGLPSGLTAVVVTSERSGACAAKLELVPGETLRWDATLRAGGAIRGMVRTTSGTPLVRWFVSARVAARTSDLEDLSGMEKLASAWTDEKGDFDLEHLTSGGYDLELFDERNDPVPAAARRNVAPGSPRLEIVVPDEALASATLAGVILAADGRVPAGVELIIGSADSRTGSRRYPVDPATGRFEVGPLPPGNYFLVARAPGLPECTRSGLHLDAGRSTDVGELRFVEAASLALTFGGDGVDLAGGEVSVDAVGGIRKTSTIVGRAATIEGLPPGSIHVAISGPGFAARQFRIDVPAGGRIERDVALVAGVAFTLRICSPAHAIPANIFPAAHVVEAGTRDRLLSTNLSDLAHSPFDWKIRLAPGRYTALVYADFQQATEVEFSVGAGDSSDRVVEIHPR